MDVSGHLCFCPFPNQRGNPCSICVFLSPLSEFRCGHAQTSRAVQGCLRIRLAEQTPESPSTKVLFHCLKNICVCLKHTLCLWKGSSFPFGELICLTKSTLSGLSSSLVHRNRSVQQEPPWMLYIAVYGGHKEKARDVTLCQTLTPRGPVRKNFKGTFCRSLQTMTG